MPLTPRERWLIDWRIARLLAAYNAPHMARIRGIRVAQWVLASREARSAELGLSLYPISDK
ncbi:hypothetical protein EGJ34_12525 [Stenotrophomonas sp. 278]|nr:hypothetical protein EGJ34_12525 [Stenotrophomonas sp. 278]